MCSTTAQSTRRGSLRKGPRGASHSLPGSGLAIIFPGHLGVAPTAPRTGSEDRIRTERSWLKFAGIGIQYGTTIALFALGGHWLDTRFDTSPIWTLSLSLFGIVGGTISLVYQVLSSDSERK